MLQIKNLHVEVEGKEILKGVNLNLKIGEVHALMGPNGSGKTTLAHVLMGHPNYKITDGKILFKGEDITNLKPDERAKRGLFLSFQHPTEISGVTISNFLRESYSSLKEKKLSLLEFKNLMEEKADSLNIDKKFLFRYLNEGFSGGEKKRTEILQLAVLDPSLAILDETDSGLDIDALKAVAEAVNFFMNKENTILIITHYKRILDYINPDKVSIMLDGKIVLEGSGNIVDSLEEKGYSWIEEERNIKENILD